MLFEDVNRYKCYIEIYYELISQFEAICRQWTYIIIETSKQRILRRDVKDNQVPKFSDRYALQLDY